MSTTIRSRDYDRSRADFCPICGRGIAGKFYAEDRKCFVFRHVIRTKSDRGMIIKKSTYCEARNEEVQQVRPQDHA